MTVNRYLLILVAVTMLSGCQTVKEKTSAVSEFFKAIGSGDTSALKKYKKDKDPEDVWEEIENKE